MSNFCFKSFGNSRNNKQEAIVFVHGYSAGHSESDRKSLMRSVPKSLKKYNCVFAFWPSSHFSRLDKSSQNFIFSAFAYSPAVGFGAIAVDRAHHYAAARTRSELMSGIFLKELFYYFRRYHPQVKKVNLIGHSLGGRLIAKSLINIKFHKNNKIYINDVLLMASAVSLDSAGAGRIRRIVGGRLINAYSDSDWTLLLNIDEKCIGRNKVDFFENFNFKNFGHCDYWERLRQVIQKTRFKSF